MTQQKISCTNSRRHAINLRSRPFLIRGIQYSYFQHNQFESKSNMTAVDIDSSIETSLPQHDNKNNGTNELRIARITLRKKSSKTPTQFVIHRTSA